jgi:small-conductance mechanosensitive channel
MRGFRMNVLVMLVGIVLAPAALGQGEAAPVSSTVAAPAAVGAEAAPLVFWNREITVFRASWGRMPPRERADDVAARLGRMPIVGPWDIQTQEARMGAASGILVIVNGVPVFVLLPEDLESAGGESLKAAADRAAARLREALDARTEQARPWVVARGLGLSLGATILLCLIVWGAARLSRRLRRQVEKSTAETHKHWHIGGINVRPTALAAKASAIRLLLWVAVLLAIYIWLTFALDQFPYTQPWGAQLGAFLQNLLGTLALGAVKAMPGLFTVLVIGLLARGVMRASSGLLLGVENGTFTVSWLDPATAKATRRILTLLVWALALIVAYPYMPGSETDVFKGVSVFLGLLATFGATGIVNQFVSGLTAVYSRAFQPGDAVRIGDTEGRVIEVGVLSTRLQAWTGERVTIPNAVLVRTTVINYSRPDRHPCEVLSTSVTVGYDTPWRQVHALLVLAAERTPHVRKAPQPHVVQKALDGHAVEYRLAVYASPSDNRMAVLSDLHAKIQDAFNEFGVQIMSPRFGAQPDRKVCVPPAAWFAAPAAPEADQVAGVDGRAGEDAKP